jgi:hypothetical protein
MTTHAQPTRTTPIPRADRDTLLAAGRAQRWTHRVGPDQLLPDAVLLDSTWYVIPRAIPTPTTQHPPRSPPPSPRSTRYSTGPTVRSPTSDEHSRSQTHRREVNGRQPDTRVQRGSYSGSAGTQCVPWVASANVHQLRSQQPNLNPCDPPDPPPHWQRNPLPRLISPTQPVPGVPHAMISRSLDTSPLANRNLSGYLTHVAESPSPTPAEVRPEAAPTLTFTGRAIPSNQAVSTSYHDITGRQGLRGPVITYPARSGRTDDRAATHYHRHPNLHRLRHRLHAKVGPIPYAVHGAIPQKAPELTISTLTQQ